VNNKKLNKNLGQWDWHISTHADPMLAHH